MIFDNTISLGGIINILVVVMGGVGFLISMKSTMAVLTSSLAYVSERLSTVERDLKTLNQVVIGNAINEEKIAGIRNELTQFVSTYFVNHQQLRRDVEERLGRLENKGDR